MYLGVVFARFQARKVYVQDKVREASALVWQAIESGAVIIVSGSSEKMPQDVREVRCSGERMRTQNKYTQHVCACVCLCMYVCMYVCIYIYIYIYTHTYIHTYTYGYPHWPQGLPPRGLHEETHHMDNLVEEKGAAGEYIFQHLIIYSMFKCPSLTT